MLLPYLNSILTSLAVQGRRMIEGMAEPTLFSKKLNHQAELFSFKKSDKQTNKWHIYKALYSSGQTFIKRLQYAPNYANFTT